VLDGEESSKEPSIALAKLLATCFVIRGAQLSIVAKIDPKAVVNVHTTLLSWIGQYIATREKKESGKQRNVAASFFKVLLPLLSNIESRDALKM
jgi:cohesin complex subunit SA-1/2